MFGWVDTLMDDGQMFVVLVGWLVGWMDGWRYEWMMDGQSLP